MKEALFFVYGSLKIGYWNNPVMGKAEFIGEHTTDPIYTLYNGGFPVVERKGETAIKGELFMCKNPTNIQGVFNLEGCPSQKQGDPDNWYDFDKIQTPHGEAIMFVMDKGQSGRTQILKDGIWK